MSNNQLPAETIERIKADALTRYPPRMASPRFMVEVDMNEDRRLSYIAGAMAEAERAQRGINLLQELVTLKERKDKEGKFIGYERLKQIAWELAKEFIQQWNEGNESVIAAEQAVSLLNPPEDNSPKGMPSPAEDPFEK